MKHRIILSALLVILITAGLNTNANAAPWRHGYCRPVVRYCPPVSVYVPPVAVGYYGHISISSIRSLINGAAL